MRAVVFEGEGAVRVADVPEPEIREPTDVVIRVVRSAICGSDLHFYHGKAPMLPGDRLGHEGVGVVEEVGDDVRSLRPGDRVAVAFNVVCGECWFCRRGQHSLCEDFRNLGAGTFGGELDGLQAERARIPAADHNLLKLPDDVDDDRALLLGDVLTTGYYGAAIAGIRPGDTVAVVGSGALGLLAAQAARLHGPERVVVLDLLPDRLAVAEELGFTSVDVRAVNPHTALADLTEGRGADVVIEAVGTVAAFDSSFDVVRRGGTVAIIGWYVAETTELQLGMTWLRMLTLVFGGVCPIHAWWERALEALREGHLDPLPLVSHDLPLEDAVRGYEVFAAREAHKVMLRP
jgi:threonine dehydrogenase-like Zn-dependent dehydrogenase